MVVVVLVRKLVVVARAVVVAEEAGTRLDDVDGISEEETDKVVEVDVVAADGTVAAVMSKLDEVAAAVDGGAVAADVVEAAPAVTPNVSPSFSPRARPIPKPAARKTKQADRPTATSEERRREILAPLCPASVWAAGILKMRVLRHETHRPPLSFRMRS